MKKTFFIQTLAAVLLIGTLAVPVHADFGYSGELDPETGEPISGSSESDGSRVTISDGVYYDREKSVYVYNVTGTTLLYSSVADKMIVQNAVGISADEGVDITIYRNGNAVENPDLAHISDSGSYTVEVTVGGQKYQTIEFTIVGSITCKLTGYSMPTGFRITEATLDGEEISYESGYVSMVNEGRYVIKYSCTRNKLNYKLDVTVDTTAPTLALAELDSKNQARGPVSIADIEEGASMTITLDGKKIGYSKELTESGEYQIVLMDSAGNITHYSFTILIYFDVNSWFFIALAVAVAAAVVIYVAVSRKKLRVR